MREVSTEASPSDPWAAWLLGRRHGGDAERLKRTLQALYPVRDRVLANAALTAGDTLLDVGTGDGLIGFAALEAVGDGGTVIFGDISEALLGECRKLARRMGVLDRCAFVRASADDLAELPSESVDAVTTRSVLIYVHDKQRALREFHRVLGPGGRLSIFEPINSFRFPRPRNRFCGYDVGPVQDLADKVRAVYRQAAADERPMLDFDERDLFAFAEKAGFREIHLDYSAEIVPRPLLEGSISW